MVVMEANNDTNTNSNGLSRAAKKRAKKRAKGQAIVAPNDLKLSSKTSNGAESSNSSGPKKIRIKRKHILKDDDANDIILDDIPHSSDEDEDVPMKGGESKEPEEKPSTHSMDVSIPDGITKLTQVLVSEDDAGDDENDNDENDSISNEVNWKTFVNELSIEHRAQLAVSFLLQPSDVSIHTFRNEYWEKKPLYVSCASTKTKDFRTRFDGFLSLETIRVVSQKEALHYNKDINVTKYRPDPKDGVLRRITLDKLVDDKKTNKNKSRVTEDVVTEYVEAKHKDIWNYFDNEACTIRLLCPHHQFSRPLHSLLSLLELEWGCMVGANAYLTPSNAAQGFAPHYDDIEAFCLQLEGQKRWKVYEPLSKEETLPRVSSDDYIPSDLANVEPVLDIVMEPGDMLYMPRGWIHQACTLDDSSDDGHSLHVTVSAMQQWSWADLLEIVMPEALKTATNSSTSTSLREGLPSSFLSYMGAMHDNYRNIPDMLSSKKKKDIGNDNKNINDGDTDSAAENRLLELQNMKKDQQEEFRAEAKNRIMRVAKEAVDLIDAACDQMGKRFLSDRVPPVLSGHEKDGTNLVESTKVFVLPIHLCRIARPGIARLVLEDGMAVLYHCQDNSVVYRQHPLSPMEFEVDDGPAIEQLLTTEAPHWICVADLIHDTIEDKVGITQALYDEGVLSIRPMDI